MLLEPDNISNDCLLQESMDGRVNLPHHILSQTMCSTKLLQ